MEFPGYVEFRLPLLKALGDGEEHRLVDLHGRISDDLDLSKDQRTQLMPNGRVTRVYSRVQWTATRLKEYGLLSRLGGGVVKITTPGANVLKDAPFKLDNEYLRGLGSVKKQDRDDSGEQQDDDEPPEEVMRRGHKGILNALYSELEDEVRKISPSGFERLVLELLKKMGYGEWIEHTGRSGDGGIDGIVRKDRLGLGEIRVQAKQCTNPVNSRSVREFMGVLHGKEGIFITTSTFVPNARKEATNNVVLIEGKDLVRLMEEYGVGVSEVENLAIKTVSVEYFEQFK